MRTTVTVDDDLLTEAKLRAVRQNRTVGEIIGDALRQSFALSEIRDSVIEIPVSGDPADRPLVDITDAEALAEALGDNAAGR